ncbi:hypothetical protein M422DRAFT_775895 [Sphaerobolus stellatus SS14]|nr:hypothetical protein M422DRAFT_775895 [Sphaerobolus stellatus SS14]
MMKTQNLAISLSALAITSVILTHQLFFLGTRLLDEGFSKTGPNIVRMKRDYTYLDDDIPPLLPMQFDKPVQMVLEESIHYSLEDPEADKEWLYNSPHGAGSYPAVAHGYDSIFIALFHQLHCLRLFRSDMVKKEGHLGHSQHCLNYLREAILCEADTTLEPGNFMTSNAIRDQNGIIKVCRDWRILYEEMQVTWVDWYRYLLHNNYSISALQRDSKRV